ncbi:zinc finger MYM-type protein 1-like [Olea europaea var. sylvestris]|uniref:zinc finger MYM-type protein 1-like n=1 Tax=Olea europaea var. sylvestris TaxID=158386 RepID=UPI000C1D080A|nr:zinc finger MYM-type protein 1-like [Olea europaea var. sylvestris]
MEHCQSSGAKKRKTLFSFFKKVNESTTSTHSEPIIVEEDSPVHHPPISSPELEPNLPPQPDIQPSILIERDPGKRKHISEHPINLQDEIRRDYLRAWPYQPVLLNYQKSIFGNQNRRFQKKWFNQFRWLEYSPSTDKAYCFYCFLFSNDANLSKSSALVTDGFNNWKRVNQGDKCAFLTHMGSTPSSFHNICVRRAEDLMRPSGHIDKVMNAITKEEVLKNRLRLKTTILSVKWLALQGCAFRGHDESSSSLNRGNFIELVKVFAKMNVEIGEVVLDKAPQNATYTSPNVQKEILHIMANRVQQMIRDELGENCFCILVDEAQDESKREQMAIILRFVNNDGVIIERFFAIKSVSDTTSSNLKNEISKDVICIWKFFSHLDNIVNIITSSPKRINALQIAQRRELGDMLASGER